MKSPYAHSLIQPGARSSEAAASAGGACAQARASADVPPADAPRTVIRGERNTTTANEIPGPFTDWVNVTYPLRENSNPVAAFAELFFPAFGPDFGDLTDRKRGVHGYRVSFGFDRGGVVFAWGGQRDTAYVSFPGEACALIRGRWPEFIALFRGALGARITRWDGAVDDYLGGHCVDAAVSLYLEGAFNLTNRKPKCSQAGNWIAPDGSGRTFYIGQRKNGKLLRVYEKGKQLGQPDSPWVRWEGELHNVDRVIPWDVLLEPARFVAGAYAALAWASAESGTRIETIKRTDAISLAHLVKHARRTYGSLFNVLMQRNGGEAVEVVSSIRRSGVPKRLDLSEAMNLRGESQA